MNRFLSFLLGSTLLFASGCSLKSSDDNTQPSALVSLYALSPSTPVMNLFVNDANIATNIPFGSYTLYNQATAGDTRIRVQTPALNPAHEGVFTTTAGSYYSVFLIDANGGTSLKSLVVQDNFGAVNDSVHLRFFNFSPDAPAVDIYSYSDSSNHKTIWQNRVYDSFPPPGSGNAFTTVKTGNYNFYAIKSGTNDTLAKFTGKNLTVPGYYTLLLEGKYKSSAGDTTLQLGIRMH